MATIHLVDDDPGVRKALCRLLRLEGYEVIAHESAESFLADPGTASPACLVLDVSLPGLDGLDLQRRLRATARDMPIVFLTGIGDIPMTVEAMRAGAVDFLTKPVEADRLLAAIREALERGEREAGERALTAEIRRRHASLTTREREVVAGLIAGKLNKQIAAELGVVEQTVKFHRARIMERMQAGTIAELMHMLAKIDGRGPRP